MAGCPVEAVRQGDNTPAAAETPDEDTLRGGMKYEEVEVE